MPNSLRCKIKHLRHNGTLTESECDRILKALEQEPCEDCVNREDVRQLICKNNDKYGYSDRFHEFTDI